MSKGIGTELHQAIKTMDEEDFIDLHYNGNNIATIWGKKGIEVSSYNPKDNSVLVESGSLVVTCDSFERRSK